MTETNKILKREARKYFKDKNICKINLDFMKLPLYGFVCTKPTNAGFFLQNSRRGVISEIPYKNIEYMKELTSKTDLTDFNAIDEEMENGTD